MTTTIMPLGNNPVVTDYEELIQRLLVPFLDAVNGVGGEVQKQGAYVAQVFGAQEMLAQVSRMDQPAEEEFMQMLESTNEALACIDQGNEDADALRKHRNGCRRHDGLRLGHIPTRGSILATCSTLCPYGRQILADFPGQDHQALVETLKLLPRPPSVSNHHPYGLVWNSRNSPEEPAGGEDTAREDRQGGAKRGKRRGVGASTADREARLDFTQMLANYEAFMASQVAPFVEAAYALDQDDVREQADAVQQAFRAQLFFMRVVSECKRPLYCLVPAMLPELLLGLEGL